MSNSKTVSVSTDFLVGVIVAFVLLFYWPAPLRHQYTATEAGVIRIDRISGKVQRLVGGGYRAMRNTDTAATETPGR